MIRKLLFKISLMGQVLEKISLLFDFDATSCLRELQEENVIAGSSVVYGCSDVLKRNLYPSPSFQH